MSDNKSFNRRNLLKNIASTGMGGIYIASNASANKGMSKDEFNQHIEQARKIQNAAGLDARVNYLEAHGIPTGYKRSITKQPDWENNRSIDKNSGISLNSSGDGTAYDDFCVEPDKCDGDIDLSLLISYDEIRGSHFVDLSMRYNYLYEDMYDGPMEPHDGAGIMWERDHWKLQDREYITDSISGDDHVAWNNGSWNFEGVGFRVNSKEIAMSSGDSYSAVYQWSDFEYAGVHLEPGSEYENGDQITAKYTYSWFGSRLNSVSVSYPWGISLGFEDQAKTKSLQTELDGTSLLVTAADAV